MTTNLHCFLRGPTSKYSHMGAGGRASTCDLGGHVAAGLQASSLCGRRDIARLPSVLLRAQGSAGLRPVPSLSFPACWGSLVPLASAGTSLSLSFRVALLKFEGYPVGCIFRLSHGTCVSAGRSRSLVPPRPRLRAQLPLCVCVTRCLMPPSAGTAGGCVRHTRGR